jgi:hypothetical protein
MSGELVPSQFRYTTTNNRDFVIGDPTDLNLDQPKYLVFQMSNLPGYNNNPHIKAEKISGNWKLSLSQNGSTTLNFSYIDSANTYTSVNTFQNTTNFTGTIVAGTASFTSVNATGNLTVGGDLVVNGTTTSLNVVNVTVNDKNIVVNKNGLASTGNGAGISVEEAGSNTGYFQVSSGRTGWDIKAPASAGVMTLIPNSSTVSLTSPTTSGTLALTSDITSALTSYVTLGTVQSITGTKTFNTVNATTFNGNLIGSLDGLSLPGAGLDGQMLTKAGSSWVWTTPITTGTDTNAVHLTGIETILTAKHFYQADLYLDYNSSLASGEGLDSKLQFRRSSTSGAPYGRIIKDYGDILRVTNNGGDGSTSDPLTYDVMLGNGLVTPAVQPGMTLTRNYTTNRVSMEISSGGAGGSAIILADRTTGTRYEIFINSGVLTVGLV